MSEIHTGAEPHTGAPEIYLTARSKEEWAHHFGIGPREVLGFIRAAIQDLVSTDKVIRTEGASSEKGNARRRLLTAVSIETTHTREGELYTLSRDIQLRVSNLVAVRNPEGKNTSPFHAKELNGLIPELNFHEIKSLIHLVQVEHGDWFLESPHPKRSGGKSWQLKREYKEAFLEAAQPHIKTLKSRRSPPGGEKMRRAHPLEPNTAGLTGWGLTGYEDVLEGYYE